jgi:ribosomal protein L16 Arg81 hydroxylase
VIQLEGIKQWLIYKPTHELPNEYTLADKDSIKEPILDITLKPGDILYFPRGFIHQAKTPKLEKNSYSTHITISTFQNKYVYCFSYCL